MIRFPWALLGDAFGCQIFWIGLCAQDLGVVEELGQITTEPQSDAYRRQAVTVRDLAECERVGRELVRYWKPQEGVAWQVTGWFLATVQVEAKGAFVIGDVGCQCPVVRLQSGEYMVRLWPYWRGLRLLAEGKEDD